MSDSPRRRRARWVAGAVGLALLAGACGSSDGATPVVAGATASSPAPTGATSPSDPDPTASTAPPTTAPPEADPVPPADAGTSPVAAVDPLTLREAVEAPPGPVARRARGPVAEPITLADGRQAWRVRIPGPHPVRSAQGLVMVGEADLGPAILTADLSALVVVTLSGDGLVAGAEVSLRWGSAPAESVGRLEVVR